MQKGVLTTVGEEESLHGQLSRSQSALEDAPTMHGPMQEDLSYHPHVIQRMKRCTPYPSISRHCCPQCVHPKRVVEIRNVPRKVAAVRATMIRNHPSCGYRFLNPGIYHCCQLRATQSSKRCDRNISSLLVKMI